jgi:hypothetical protein
VNLKPAVGAKVRYANLEWWVQAVDGAWLTLEREDMLNARTLERTVISGVPAADVWVRIGGTR